LPACCGFCCNAARQARPNQAPPPLALQACGLSIGVAPFVSKRGLGQVYGFVGAGGNIGAAVTQALFFAGNFE
jgi:hypothetical protein